MNRSTKGLLIVTTTLDGFSLVNCRQFVKFAKLSTHQTFASTFPLPAKLSQYYKCHIFLIFWV